MYCQWIDNPIPHIDGPLCARVRAFFAFVFFEARSCKLQKTTSVSLTTIIAHARKQKETALKNGGGGKVREHTEVLYSGKGSPIEVRAI